MAHGNKGHRRSSGLGITSMLRMLLSLFMMSILALGLLKAYQSFSGTDPLDISPGGVVNSVSSSESLFEIINGLLTLSPDKAIDGVKKLLGGDSTPVTGGSLGLGQSTPEAPKGTLLYKFAVISDSHNDTLNLKKALTQAKDSGAKFVIGMGDFSDVGTIDELSSTKEQFDAINLPYYVIPGDHDLWDSRDKGNAPEKNFTEIFGKPYQSFTYENSRFILVYDSDNYLGLGDFQLKWLEDELDRVASEGDKTIFVFASTPFYHPSSDHFMGKVTPKLKDQATHIMSKLQRAGTAQVFSADTHMYSSYKEPTTSLNMVTTGAITSDRNPQTPRFLMVEVYEEGSYNISSEEVK